MPPPQERGSNSHRLNEQPLENATLDAAAFSDTVGTLDVTGNVTIDFETGGRLAFADSSAMDWSDGTLNLTGALVSGFSLRFGTDSNGLPPAQLALISASGFVDFALDGNGYLTATNNNPPTLAGSDIVDDKSGGPIGVGTLVTYTLTFNKNMDESTVDASDFGNAGSATVTIGTRSLRIQRILNAAATAATLTINNSGDYTYSGRLGDGGANFGLTKSGTGIFTLTGTLSYAGDTTVTGGTLSLGSTNGGNNLSTVTVASGAKLKLTYASTDTVAALVINGAPLAGGVYGHTDSGATNGGQGVGFFDAYFEPGSGTLTIPVGFAAWITGTFANGTVTHQGPNDDDDNDGISNLVEYAIAGQDPTVPNAAIGSFDGSTLTFTKRADTSGLTYAIQESTDLGDTDVWTEVPAGPTYTNNATTISYTLPGGPAKDFMRLAVTSN